MYSALPDACSNTGNAKVEVAFAEDGPQILIKDRSED
jgi:hypothetical protein